MRALTGKAGFDPPAASKTSVRQRIVDLELMATAALAVSLVVALTVVSIEIARADALGASSPLRQTAADCSRWPCSSVWSWQAWAGLPRSSRMIERRRTNRRTPAGGYRGGHRSLLRCYCALMPAAFTIGHHFSVSAIWYARRPSGVC